MGPGPIFCRPDQFSIRNRYVARAGGRIEPADSVGIHAEHQRSITLGSVIGRLEFRCVAVIVDAAAGRAAPLEPGVSFAARCDLCHRQGNGRWRRRWWRQNPAQIIKGNLGLHDSVTVVLSLPVAPLSSAVFCSASRISAFVFDGYRLHTSAATPVTCGVAIDVPFFGS